LDNAIIIFCTTPDMESAEDISQKLIESKLAACCNIISNMKSVYFWKNKIQHDQEQLILIKTLASKFTSVQELISAEHPYDLPEIVSVKIADVSKSYLSWITETVRAK